MVKVLSTFQCCLFGQHYVKLDIYGSLRLGYLMHRVLHISKFLNVPTLEGIYNLDLNIKLYTQNMIITSALVLYLRAGWKPTRVELLMGRL